MSTHPTVTGRRGVRAVVRFLAGAVLLAGVVLSVAILFPPAATRVPLEVEPVSKEGTRHPAAMRTLEVQIDLAGNAHVFRDGVEIVDGPERVKIIQEANDEIRIAFPRSKQVLPVQPAACPCDRFPDCCRKADGSNSRG
jgi:hypothetical protein